MGRTVMLFAAGSRGDVQPCLALAQSLMRHGHAVRVLASTRYEQLITSTGAGFHPVAADPSDIVGSATGQELLGSRQGPVAFVRTMNRVLRPHIENLLDEAFACAAGADLVLAPAFGLFGVHLNQRLGVPHAVVHFQPSQPTRAFPHPFVPAARRLGPFGNRVSYDIVDAGTWLLSRRHVNRWRVRHHGLAPLPRLSPMRATRRSTVLCAFSPTVVPRPSDWGPDVHVTGFWDFPQPDWRPPQRLTAFLLAGPPPVYVGFGSMRTGDPRRTDRTVRAALRRAGLRGVLLGDPSTSEDDMLVLAEAPHGWLFPRMAAVVHHGGAGTTCAALRAGVPNVVCPFFGDQPYWASRVHALGAGPPPLPARDLTADALAEQLTAVTGNTAFGESARRIAGALRAEDGANRACDVLRHRFALG
ncbi:MULTISPECIES: glycosyltransferase [unclassified Streptomyces]|uniref:glycosyltransferase n=1 Tax=unclassified Streptomyces TaxID=2593676 RepID=UPI003D7053E4